MAGIGGRHKIGHSKTTAQERRKMPDKPHDGLKDDQKNNLELATAQKIGDTTPSFDRGGNCPAAGSGGDGKSTCSNYVTEKRGPKMPPYIVPPPPPESPRPYPPQSPWPGPPIDPYRRGAPDLVPGTAQPMPSTPWPSSPWRKER